MDSQQGKTEDLLLLLESALEASANGVAITGRDATFIWVNSAFTRLTGYSAEELIGQNPRLLKSGEHGPAFYERLWRTVLSGRTWRGELINRRKDGSLYAEEQTITPVCDEDGAITHFIAIKQDVTERKRVEKALQDSEDKLIEAQKIAQLGYYVLNIKTGYWTNSAELDDIFGTDENHKKDVAGWLQIIHPDFRETMLNYLQDNILSQHQKFDMEYKIINLKTGQEKWVSGLGRLGFDDDNNPVEMFGTIQDITERKQAREALQLFRTLIDQSNDTFEVVDPNTGRFLDVNEHGYRSLGYSREEFLDLCIWDIAPGSDPPTFAEHIKVLKETGSTVQEGIHRRKDGSTFLVEVNARYVRLDRDYLIGAARDITERKQAEDALIRAKEEAEAMSRLKSAFLTNMSHEFRTPLAGILGFAQILSDEVPESQREYVRHISVSGHRLLNMLNAILDLSMIEAGSVQPRLAVCDVDDEAQRAVALLQPLAWEKGVSLRIAEPPSGVEARLDPVLLGRILNNLIDNALKFTRDGEVVVAVRGVAEQVEIAVRDTGIGIDERFIPYLFDAFSQESTGMSRSHEGGGLGLVITKHLVALQGGQIAVESRKGEGSTFRVSFPRLPAHQDEMPAQDVSLSTKRRSSPIRVLAVDDNPAMLVLLERFLEEMPGIAGMDGVQDGETALTLARRHRYDVVLMDINLGGVRTGDDVLHTLRRMPAYHDVPVIAVTAYAFPGDRERFLTAGFDAYLGKPFTQEQLGAVLMQVGQGGK